MAQASPNLKIKLNFSIKDLVAAIEELEPEEKELLDRSVASVQKSVDYVRGQLKKP